MSYNRLLYVAEDLQRDIDPSFLTSNYSFTNSLEGINLDEWLKVVVATSRVDEVKSMLLSTVRDELYFIWSPFVSAHLGYFFSHVFSQYPALRVIEASQGQYLLRIDRRPASCEPAFQHDEVNRIIRITESATLVDRDFLRAVDSTVETVSKQLEQMAFRSVQDPNLSSPAKLASQNAPAETIFKAQDSRLAELEKLLNVERRRYEALSKSKLGKLTLKYWDIRRKNNGK